MNYQVGDIVKTSNIGTVMIAHVRGPKNAPAYRSEDIIYLVRDANGIETEIDESQVVSKLADHELAELTNLYFLSVLALYKALDIPERISIEVEAECYSSAREMSILHKISVGYDNHFSSNSLFTSLDKVVQRHYENQAHEVKALPAF